MSSKIVVGPFSKGLKTNVEPFAIDNDSFPTLINAYQWRGRVKRKRGTSLLSRLQRHFNSTSTSYNSGSATFALVAGAGNILTGFSLQANGNIVPGTVTIVNTTVAQTYTDPGADGVLVGSIGGSGTINYATGAITISGGAGNSVSAVFNYYPVLPVMGLEDFVTSIEDFPKTLAFDTTYSYLILTTTPHDSYDVSFYKNPPVSATNLPGYVPKTAITPTTWNGQDYQQFWTVNYEGALWATNGIEVPFDTTNVGMQYKPITGIAIITAGNGTTIPAVADLTIIAHGLVQGDFLFINEVGGITGINFQTGYVTSANPQAANTVRVTFPFAILGGAYTTGGIAQYLTNRSDTTKDCLRWFDGDPTDGDPDNPILDGNKGWVNFAPPISQSDFSIANLPPDQYYLVGARMIVPFKDRLLFIGVIVQTSAAGSQAYLPDTVIYSQNGTPYYTSSFFENTTGFVTDPQINFHSILTPAASPTQNFTTSPASYFADVTGFGGFITAGFAQPIISCASNEDVLIMGFLFSQSRFVYTGNDINPFLFYQINSEFGTASTFSTINMGAGVLTKSTRGYIMTSQTDVARVDLEIPDQVFEVDLTHNGNERFCSQRDFINEWVFLTYPGNSVTNVFPNTTLQYNYRDQSWAVFYECYTTYGLFRERTGFTWNTVGAIYPTWSSWNDPWNAGESTLLQPEVIAGTPQGFVMQKSEGTEEGNSITIQSFSGNTVTSPNHGLNENDYIIISEAIGTISEQVNGRIFSVFNVDTNTFQLDPAITSGTYLGGGLIKRIYVPLIQTKQFPLAWGIGRKTRIGPQQYLLTTTQKAQIELQIYLSQNGDSPYNFGPIVPDPATENSSLIYTSVLYTCPESTNLGLTPANSNLNMPTAVQQSQIWHRMNTSLIGDTVQLGFTLNDTQLRALDTFADPLTITGATQASSCVLTCANDLSAGQFILIENVVGMTELNGNAYLILSATSTDITINVDSTGFTAYISGGRATLVGLNNQFAEIELHGMIIEASPSMALA